MQKNFFALATSMATLAAAENSSPIDFVCAAKVENPTTAFEASQVGLGILAVLNKEMCSFNCPCPIEAEISYKKITEAELVYYSRELLHFSHSGKSFDTFQQCWNERLSTSDMFDASFVTDMNN